jgi:hypothetical protein
MSYTLDYHFTTETMEHLKNTCNVHNFSKENEDKYLVSYNKSKSLVKENIYTTGLQRSLIFLNGNLVSFSPPKSLSYDYFCSKYPTLDENILIEEFIEGTMINVYYNNISNNWEIATKNNIGGTNSCNKNSVCNFGNMFYDTCRYIGFDLESGLNKKYCYSFVMKHPYNPMIEIVTHPALYLIDVYEIDNVSDSNILIHIKNRNEIVEELTIHWDIKIPRQIKFNNYEDINFLKLFQTNDVCYIRKCITMGYVIRNLSTGERTKLRNQEYEYLHKLRGNQMDFFYRYLELRQLDNVKEFLKYFPENYNLFISYRDTLHNFTENVYLYYFMVNVTRTATLGNIPNCYKKMVYKLHGLYISEKINNPSFKISRKYVIDYVNKLHPSILIKCLNEYVDDCYNTWSN